MSRSGGWLRPPGRDAHGWRGLSSPLPCLDPRRGERNVASVFVAPLVIDMVCVGQGGSGRGVYTLHYLGGKGRFISRLLYRACMRGGDNGQCRAVWRFSALLPSWTTLLVLGSPKRKGRNCVDTCACTCTCRWCSLSRKTLCPLIHLFIFPRSSGPRAARVRKAVAALSAASCGTPKNRNAFVGGGEHHGPARIAGSNARRRHLH